MLIECFCGCRNKIEQSCAYKIILGGTRKVYFLNEQHYLRWQDKNSAKSNKIDEKEFAPIKNKTGVDSVESARELLKKNGVTL